MASPFRIFRKHQKALMVVAVVVAMFVFVIGDALFSYVGQTASGSRSPQATVVTWNGGSMSAEELGALTERRLFISDYLNRLRSTGAQRVLAEGGNPLLPTVPNFIIPEEQEIREVQIGVVTTRLMAEEARKAGFVVGDDVINHFLRETSFRRVSDQEMVDLLAGGRGQSAMEERLFSGLRELLLANHYMTGYGSALRNVLPEERWQDWKRVNHRISLDAAIVPASAFVDQVPEPSEAELLAFYEQHKDAVGGIPHFVMGMELPSPTPGFAEPRRVKISYLTGDVDARAQQLLDSVTDEEISEYYEENKDALFEKTSTSNDLRSFDELFGDEPGGVGTQEEPPLDELESEPTEETPAQDPPAEDASPATEDEPTAPPEPEETTTEEEPPVDEPASVDDATEPAEPTDDVVEDSKDDQVSDDSTSSEGSANDEATTDDTSDDDTSDDDTAADEGAPENEATEETAEGADDETSHILRPSPFRLVAFQDNEVPENEDPDGESSENESNEVEGVTAEEAAAPGEESARNEDADSLEDGNADESDADDKSSASEDESDDEEPVEYVPLEDVRDSIRLQLATQKATEEIRRTLNREIADLRSVYNPYGFDVVEARSEGREPPAPPEELTNLVQRAKDSGLTSEETVLLSQRELMDTMVGRAVDSQTQRQTVAQAAFGTLHTFEPLLAEDIAGSVYLVLKTEDQPARVPEFQDVRDEVLAAWKSQEAQKLALEAAKQFAEECQESEESLDGFFTDKPYEVVTTDMFSWLSFGATPMEMQRGPRMSDAPPLEDVGPDFMTEAFKLEADEVAAVTNYDGSQAYVIRLARRERTEEELRQLFLSEANDWYGAQVMTYARMQNNELRLMERLTERMGLDVEMLEEYFAPQENEF